jgi:hypothetical protein
MALQATVLALRAQSPDVVGSGISTAGAFPNRVKKWKSVATIVGRTLLVPAPVAVATIAGERLDSLLCHFLLSERLPLANQNFVPNEA